MGQLIQFLVIFTIFTFLHSSDGFSASKIYPRRKSVLRSGTRSDAGDPLFLTPLINDGKLEEARNSARVSNISDVVSYSGYLTVNPKYNSNMFFWFFPAAVRLKMLFHFFLKINLKPKVAHIWPMTWVKFGIKIKQKLC